MFPLYFFYLISSNVISSYLILSYNIFSFLFLGAIFACIETVAVTSKNKFALNIMTRTVSNSLFRASSTPSSSTSNSVTTSYEDSSQNVLLKECSSSSMHIEAFANLASNHRTFFPYHRTFSKRTNNIPKELNYSNWKISLQTPILLTHKNNENSSESVKNESNVFDKDGKYEFGNNKKDGNSFMRSLPGEQEKFPFGRDSTNKGNYRSLNNSSGDLENLNNNNDTNTNNNNTSTKINNDNNNNENLNYLNIKKNQENINEGNKILERYNSVESLLISPDSEEKNFDFISHSTSNEKKRNSDTKKMTLSRNSSDFGINETFFPGGISTERMRISKENEKIERSRNDNINNMSMRGGSGKNRNDMLLARRSSLSSFNSFDEDSDDDDNTFQRKNDLKNNRSKNILNKNNINHNNNDINIHNNNDNENQSIIINDNSTKLVKNSYGKKMS